MPQPYFIGIAGPSGSGKSELSHRLARTLAAPVLSLDHYYREYAHLPFAQRELINFDEPASIDDGLLLSHVARLAAGLCAEIPAYDFRTHNRMGTTTLIAPAPVIVIEGLFTLYWHALRDLLDTKVYVELEDEVCFARRLGRDVRERGRTPENVRWQYETTVRPMAETYIRPTSRHADVIVRGDGQLDESVRAVLAHRLRTESPAPELAS